MEAKQKVFVVILNYKSWEDTIECLESVLKMDGDSFQIILVDNSPNDTSINQITSWAKGDIKNIETLFPELVCPLVPKPIDYISITEKQANGNVIYGHKLVVVKAASNKGFSAGNNIALRYIDKFARFGDKIWLLNNDTVVEPDALSKYIVESNQNIGHGIIGAKLMEYSDGKKIQALGGFYNSWIGRIRILTRLEYDVKNKIVSDYPIGASMFIDHDFLKKIGYMEEKYFLYFEEYDWVLRGNKLGFNSFTTPKIQIYHKGGGSSGGNTSKLADFYGIRSKIIFTKKFFPLKLPFLYLSFTFFVVNRLRRRQFDRIPMLFSLLANPSQEFHA